MQGLSTKKMNLELLLDKCKPDIVAVSETWLKNCDIFNLQNYNLITKFCRSKYVRGGVCLYVRNRFTSSVLDNNQSIEKDFQFCTTKIKTNCHIIVVIVIYSLLMGICTHSLQIY